MSRDKAPLVAHWFTPGNRTADFGYVHAPLCRCCGETLSFYLHRSTTRSAPRRSTSEVTG